MFDATIETVATDRIMRYGVRRDEVALTFSEVIQLWKSDRNFRSYYTQLLAESPFSAYRWETPGLTHAALHQSFEFVLVNSPEFSSRKTDNGTFDDFFTKDDADNGVISFANLRGDATLVVPSPRTNHDAYGHLAAFLRNAPRQQLDSLWQVVGNTIESRISETPVWLSTAGGGVAWLHVRLDSRPKYYSYAPYRTALR